MVAIVILIVIVSVAAELSRCDTIPIPRSRSVTIHNAGSRIEVSKRRCREGSAPQGFVLFKRVHTPPALGDLRRRYRTFDLRMIRDRAWGRLRIPDTTLQE
jgi:hypothetical protein